MVKKFLKESVKDDIGRVTFPVPKTGKECTKKVNFTKGLKIEKDYKVPKY